MKNPQEPFKPVVINPDEIVKTMKHNFYSALNELFEEDVFTIEENNMSQPINNVVQPQRIEGVNNNVSIPIAQHSVDGLVSGIIDNLKNVEPLPLDDI